ncbi:MAG TPA: DUF5329 family protein [Phycisphaerae bacterium]|nr:DUF5329 family protein [Phycisphaerae bacterium]
MKLIISILASSLLFSAACDDRSHARGPTGPDAPATSGPAASQPASRPAKRFTENQKIEKLISHVEKLQNAVFVRNGDEHTCVEAAKHMRDKWKWKRSEIRTARDFIRVAASKSSMTGRPYLIRFKNGSEKKSGEYLLRVLKQIEDKPDTTSQPATRPERP